MVSPVPAPAAENLLAQVAEQRAQIRWLELRVKDLETQLFGRKSEQRRGAVEENNNLEWAELLGAVQALAPTPPVPPTKSPGKKSAIPMGPKPLDPALRRPGRRNAGGLRLRGRSRAPHRRGRAGLCIGASVPEYYAR